MIERPPSGANACMHPESRYVSIGQGYMKRILRSVHYENQTETIYHKRCDTGKTSNAVVLSCAAIALSHVHASVSR